MFLRNKWLLLALIAAALLCNACDPEPVKVPLPPSNVRAAAVSPTSISITWNPVSSAVRYNVYLEIGSEPSYLITVPGPSHTHTGLQPNTTYYYYVTAENNSGTKSDYSSRASATTLSL